MHLVLASSSPRRQALLREAGFSFRIQTPDTEEILRPGETPRGYVERNAREKAQPVWASLGEEGQSAAVVLAADTVVVCDEEILEKPRDAADAEAMLRRLSGRGHEVMTGVCLQAGTCDVFSVATSVYFHPISREEIVAYVQTGEPLDKAGAYAVQGGAAPMVERVVGSYTNVVGLPMEEVVTRLDALGVGQGLARSSPAANVPSD